MPFTPNHLSITPRNTYHQLLVCDLESTAASNSLPRILPTTPDTHPSYQLTQILDHTLTIPFQTVNLTHPTITMEPSKPTTSLPSSNPPSVEIAYKRKSIALKKRLNEVESENELMRVRNKRGWKYVQKMRLESCMLLDRLAKVTGMAEEAQAGTNPELRARASALMSNAAALNGVATGGAAGQTAGNGAGYFEDETEGSSDEQPPTVSFPSAAYLILHAC